MIKYNNKERLETDRLHKSYVNRSTTKVKKGGVDFLMFCVLTDFCLVNFPQRACTKFPDDVKMWMSHVQFCKKWVSCEG